MKSYLTWRCARLTERTKLAPGRAACGKAKVNRALQATAFSACAILVGCGSGTSAKEPTNSHRHTAKRSESSRQTAKPTYPPFVSESNAKTVEVAQVKQDLSSINRSLGNNAVVSFTATTVEGVPQFNYIVNQSAWDAVPKEVRDGAVKPGGAIFGETDRVYRKYHRGRVCLPPDTSLMLHVLNESGVDEGFDYTVFVATNEC